MTELAGKYLDTDLVRFINGAVPETTRVSTLRWQYEVIGSECNKNVYTIIFFIQVLELQWDHSESFRKLNKNRYKLNLILFQFSTLVISVQPPSFRHQSNKYCFVTIGGGRVARVVAEAAAKHLTPITLELGGKSPVIIDPACDLKLAAKRILWGKVVNAGQTCVAPDYILVPRAFQDTFVQALKEVYEQFYPDADKRSAVPDAYSRLVSPQAHGRIAGLLEKTKGEIVFGGEVDKDTKFISPTVVKDVGPDDSLMSEWVFFCWVRTIGCLTDGIYFFCSVERFLDLCFLSYLSTIWMQQSDS